MIRIASICLASFGVVLGLASALADSPAQDSKTDRPRILVTNDDGIDAPGLRVLVAELAAFADVTVCAPASNRSGASQSVTYFSFTVFANDVDVDGAANAVALSGTPADAAHFGIVHLGRDQPFDLLISGINHGSNVGDLSHGSGTVGAAMEGAFRRVPSIAVSMDARLRDRSAAAAFTRRFVEQLLKRGADPDIVYSLNIPPQREGGWKGVRATPMGGSYLKAESYRAGDQTEDGTTYRAAVEFVRDGPEGSDTQAYMDGFITITPLRFDWTHREALADLETWEFDSN